MKTIKKIMILASLLFVTNIAFSKETKKMDLNAKSNTMTKKTIDTAKSLIKWKGQKELIKDEHYGDMKFNNGEIYFNGDKPVSGNFEVNMNSMVVRDIPNTDENKEKIQKLIGHLQSDHFFNTKKYPKAKLTVKSFTPTKVAGVYQAKGFLTIRDKTNPVEFDFKTNDYKTATGKFQINRSLFNVKYNSPSIFSIDKLKDKAIADMIDISFTVNL